MHNQCKSLTVKPPQPEYIFSFHDVLTTKCYKHGICTSSCQVVTDSGNGVIVCLFISDSLSLLSYLHFAKCSFLFHKVQISYRKIQIFILQSTDFPISQSIDFFHFAKYRFSHFTKYRFFSFCKLQISRFILFCFTKYSELITSNTLSNKL